MKDENSDRLGKIRNVFDILNKKFSKFYKPSEHLAAEEFIFKYKNGHYPTVNTQETQTFWDQNLQTVRRYG